MDEGKKVQILKKGIKAPLFKAAISVINSIYEKYGHDFHAVVAYLGTLIKEHYANKKVYGGPHIAAALSQPNPGGGEGGSHGGGARWGGGDRPSKGGNKYGPGFPSKIENRSYSKEEYAQLSKKQVVKLWELRNKKDRAAS